MPPTTSSSATAIWRLFFLYLHTSNFLMTVRDEKAATNKEEDIAGFDKVLEEELGLLSELRNGGIKHDTNVPIFQRARNYDLAPVLFFMA